MRPHKRDSLHDLIIDYGTLINYLEQGLSAVLLYFHTGYMCG